MIFGDRSDYMLRYSKTRAKLVEFSVHKEDYPSFPLNPDDLIYTTIYALSTYCEVYNENAESTKLPDLRRELIFVSRFFDSAIKTGENQTSNSLFLLLGSTAFFLAEDFGSSKVLIEQIVQTDQFYGDIIHLLYSTLYYLHKGKWCGDSSSELQLEFEIGLRSHFESGESPNSIFSALFKLREMVIRVDNVYDLNFIDFLISVMHCALSFSAWRLLPLFSHTTISDWKEYLSKPNSIKLLWPAQRILLNSRILLGKDLVVPLPPGVGKTKSIELLVRSCFMKKDSNIALIIAPLKALCNEITTDLETVIGDEVTINQLSDVFQEDYSLTLQPSSKYLFICTPEKFSFILRHDNMILGKISLFIFDEAHLFDDSSRGVQYELLVSEIVRKRNQTAQFVLFSAVLPNSDKISGWLFGDESVLNVNMSLKSTEKAIGFISSNQQIHYYEKDTMDKESYFVPKSIEFVTLNHLGKERKKRTFPEINAVDLAIYYSNKQCHHGGAAIFAGQIRSVNKIMRRLLDVFEHGYSFQNLLASGDSSEIGKLSNLIGMHYGENSDISRVARLGAFPHYSLMPNGIKIAIEYALREKHISVIICTTTLAEGVNIPIKYLFITTFQIGESRLQIRKLQNMIGRTARSGIHTEGSVIVTDNKLFDSHLIREGGGIYKWDDCIRMFDSTNSEACSSSILTLVSDIVLDFETTFESEKLIEFLEENISDSTCFHRLENYIFDQLKVRNPNIQIREKLVQTIRFKTKNIEHVVSSIENYLCYVYGTQLSNEDFINLTDQLSIKTYAYYSADDIQKMALRRIFNQIALRIISTVEPDKSTYFARSIYGIERTTQIIHG